MARNNDLDLDAIDVDEDPAFSFKLGGKRWHVRNRDAIDSIAYSLAQQHDDLTSLFRAVIVSDEVDDFLGLVAEPDVLPAARADALTEAIVEALADRPTRRSSTSGRGPQQTARRSGGASRSRETVDL